MIGSYFTPNGSVTFTIGGMPASISSGGVANSYGYLLTTDIIVPSLNGGTYPLIATDVTTEKQSQAAQLIVNPGPIAAQGLPLQAKVNAPLTNISVGTFTDNAGLPSSSYSISISWGDGSSITSSGQSRSAHAGVRVRPSGVSQQYSITGSHTYTGAGTYPINVTIHAADGRTAYLMSIAQVSAASSSVTYQVQAGWNLIGPQLPPGATMPASSVAADILGASSGNLVALYALTNGAWSAPYIAIRDSQPSGLDFMLHGGIGYLVYSDKQATFSVGSVSRHGAGEVIRAWLTPSRRAQVPPLPPRPLTAPN